jgi:ribosomal protein S4E
MDPKALEEFRKTWQDKAFQFKFDDKEMQKHFQEMEKNGQLFKLAPGQKGFIVDGKNFKPMDEKQMKEMEKHFQEMGKDGLFQHFKMDPNHKGFIVDGKNFKQFDEKQMKEMQKHFEEMEKSSAFQHFKIDPNQKGFIVDGKNFKPMDEKQMKELHKHLQEMEKSGAFQHFKMEPGQKGFSWGEDFKQLDGQQIKEMQKHFQEMGKDGFFKSFKIDPNQKGYIMDGKTQRPMTDKEMKTWRDKLEKAAKANAKGHPFTWNSEKSFFDGPNVSTSASAHNLKAIYDTLTPAQEQKLKRLGYINYSDLNSKQRNLLGVVTDESWTISYKTDKASLTIKSDR